MKNKIAKTVAAGVIAAVVGTASAETSVSMDFVSAYVFRGVTLNDGASFQPGIEASGLGLDEKCGSVTVGAWGSAGFEDSYAVGNIGGSTFQESDWYGSYGLPTIVEGLDVSVGYTEYSYAVGSADKEVNIGLGYELAGVALSATYYQFVGGAFVASMYGELGAGYDIEASTNLVVSLGARVGYADWDGGESGFSDYDLSIGASYTLSDIWSIGASVAYIGQIDDKVLPDAVASTGSLGY
ncbi:MAG: hypothetical protein K9M54_13510, partial [Kiritimatiellales bacterium]|nr:hypothetical protein [Kiritimatiellales bacterium]